MQNFPNIQMTMAAGEPSGPRPSEPNDPPTILVCPDCGTSGSGNYCAECGELLEPALPSVLHYIKELVQDIAAFDSKLVRTVPALLFRPGFLTKEYLAGRRKRYLVPSRLYLLTGLLVFFALGSFLHRAFLSATTKPALQAALSDSTKISPNAMKLTSQQIQYSFGSIKGEDARQAVDKLIGLAVEVSPYVILLASTPLFALLLWILYRKKRPLYVEHLIFSFHFFAFALIVLIAGVLVKSTIVSFIGFILFLVYLFIAMRKVYADRGFGLVLRFLTVSSSYFALATMAIALSVTIAYFIGLYTGELPDLRSKGRAPSVQDSLFLDSLSHSGGNQNLKFYFNK